MAAIPIFRPLWLPTKEIEVATDDAVLVATANDYCRKKCQIADSIPSVMLNLWSRGQTVPVNLAFSVMDEAYDLICCPMAFGLLFGNCCTIL